MPGSTKRSSPAGLPPPAQSKVPSCSTQGQSCHQTEVAWAAGTLIYCCAYTLTWASQPSYSAHCFLWSFFPPPWCFLSYRPQLLTHASRPCYVRRTQGRAQSQGVQGMRLARTWEEVLHGCCRYRESVTHTHTFGKPFEVLLSAPPEMRWPLETYL